MDWNTASGTGTPTFWTNGNNAFFTGTAGVVTFSNGALNAAAMSIQTTGYSFTTSAASRNLTVTGALSLSNGVATAFEISSGNGAATWSVGSISSGAGASLTLKGGASATNADILAITSATTVSVDTAIAQSTGGTAGNAIGYLASAGGTMTVPATVGLASNVTNNSTAQLLLGANQFNTLNYSGRITGSGGVTFSANNAGGGAGTVNVTGTTSDYSGNTIVNTSSTGQVILNSSNGTALGATTIVSVSKGSLILGADNQVPAAAAMKLGGGTFNTGGFSEGTASTAGVGALTLLANSSIDLGAGNASLLHFSDSNAQTWTTGLTLSILNYSGAVRLQDGTFTGTAGDALFFGTSVNGLTTTQLSEIAFVNPAGYTGTFGAYIDGSGEVFAAVPEPGTVAAGLLALGSLGWSEWRRLRGAGGTRRPRLLPVA